MPKIAWVCKQCGKAFSAYIYKDGEGSYCSIDCYKAKRAIRVIKVCYVCGKEYEIIPYRQTRGTGNYCSANCYHISRRTGAYFKCYVCGKQIYKSPGKSNNKQGHFCSYACHRIHNRGANNPVWKNGITPENTQVKNSPEYKKWRTAVFVRDHFTCQHCGKEAGSLEAHHIIPFSTDKSLRLEITNGITLCVKCHKQEHKRLRSMLKGQENFFVG